MPNLYTGITVFGLNDIAGNAVLGVPGAAAPAAAIQDGAVYSTTAPSPANGQLVAAQSDQSGNSLAFPGIQFKTGAAWNSGTGSNTLQYATGTATIGAFAGAPAYLIALDQTTTITQGAVTFQGTYDGTNWITIPTAQVLNPATFAQLTNPYTFVPSTNVPFLILSQGFIAIRAELSTVILGSGSVTPNWATLAYEPSITTSAGSTVSGTLSNNNAVPSNNNLGVLPAIAETAYTTATYTTGDMVLPVTDLHGALNTDVQAVGGTAVVTAASGVQMVGIEGHGAATLDSTVGSGTAPTNALAVSGIYSTTEPAPTATQATAVQQDQSANLLNFPGVQFKTGTVWAGGSTPGGTFQYPTGTTTQGQLSGAPAYLVALDQTTTITAGAVTFQGTYDNVNWTTIPVAQVLNPNTYAPLTNPYTLQASTNIAFLILAQGYVGIRTDVSTTFTGSGSVTPYWASLATEPTNLPLSGTTIVDGTLTNNNAAPTASLIGVLPAIAETAYTTVTYTTGDLVLPVTDLHGALNEDLQAVAGVQLGATGVTAFGSAPAAVNVVGVNASIFQGTAAISAANPLFTEISDGTNAMGAMANFGTGPGAVKAVNANVSLFSGTTALTNTGGALNVEIAGSSGNTTVVGNLTNNNAAPTTTNIGSLDYIATASAEAYTQGDQVLATTSLGGAVRMVPVDEANASSLSYYSFDNAATQVAVGTTLIPLLSIETNSSSIIFLLRGINVGSNGTIALVRVVKNGTLTGATFTGTEGNMKTDIVASAITAGTVVFSGYVGTVNIQQALLQAIAAGTPGDKFSICGQSITGTAQMLASIQWSEQSAAL
jgi:hypothetical protein